MGRVKSRTERNGDFSWSWLNIYRTLSLFSLIDKSQAGHSEQYRTPNPGLVTWADQMLQKSCLEPRIDQLYHKVNAELVDEGNTTALAPVKCSKGKWKTKHIHAIALWLSSQQIIVFFKLDHLVIFSLLLPELAGACCSENKNSVRIRIQWGRIKPSEILDDVDRVNNW